MFDQALDFLLNQNPHSLTAVFWMPLFIEIPRYFLGGMIIAWFVLFRRDSDRTNAMYEGGISVVVPGHNNADCIRQTVLSLREQTLKTLQIIVVNDGSNDETHSMCRALERRGLIDDYILLRSRSGKSAAVNAALQRVRYPLFLVTDADTTFDRTALAVAASYFRDPTVGAVGGTLRVRNINDSVLTWAQHINYAFSITLGRIVKDVIGFYFVASGAFGLYRTDAVRAIGGWDFGPGEDGDTMARLRVAGWRARFAPFAVAMTDVPTTFPALGRQRLRWNRSMVRLRFRKARNYVINPLRAHFDFAFALSFFDIYYFRGLVPFLFVIYLSYIFYLYGSFAFIILMAMMIFYSFIAIVKYFLALSVSTRPREDFKYIFCAPLYGLVNVYFLRFIRLYAVTNELIFRGSYSDSYVPAKVRNRVEMY
ncbi:MAG: glycosyltransferase family 2 protein [Rhodospirillales bacterium]|nr:glycosyltransferase family 2 protein [Rhodospirillales bacterium]